MSATVVDVPEWMLDARGWRQPVPRNGWPVDDAIEDMDDFRKEVFRAAIPEMIAQLTNALLAEIRFAYQHSDEIRALHGALDQGDLCNRPIKGALALSITSSNKYTRIKFPNCPKLRTTVLWILARHKCDTAIRPHMHSIHVEITIPRLGQINEFTDFQP